MPWPIGGLINPLLPYVYGLRNLLEIPCISLTWGNFSPVNISTILQIMLPPNSGCFGDDHSFAKAFWRFLHLHVRSRSSSGWRFARLQNPAFETHLKRTETNALAFHASAQKQDKKFKSNSLILPHAVILGKRFKCKNADMIYFGYSIVSNEHAFLIYLKLTKLD